MMLLEPYRAYALCNQDPADINLDLNDLKGFTLVSSYKFGPSNVTENILIPTTILADLGFEAGSVRMFEMTNSFRVASAVLRFSNSSGAESLFDYCYNTQSSQIIQMTETIGDESVALHDQSSDVYGICFRKSNVLVVVGTETLAYAEEYAKIIESKIKVTPSVSDFWLIIGIVSVASVLIVAIVIIMWKRGMFQKVPQQLQ